MTPTWKCITEYGFSLKTKLRYHEQVPEIVYLIRVQNLMSQSHETTPNYSFDEIRLKWW